MLERKDTMTLAINTLVGERYRINRMVGQGGFGVVFEAFHLELQRKVALKMLIPEVLYSETQREVAISRVAEEGLFLTKLRHPNIVQALDFGWITQDDGQLQPYLVMEWIEGPTLRSWLKEHGKLPLHTALTVFEAILDAMAHAHQERVVHRDLKGSNIMLEGDPGAWRPLVVDFGIARLVEGDASAGSGNTLSCSGGSPHTPAYAAPEQLTSGRTGPWTDVHSLGVLLIEMLHGESPFCEPLWSADPARPTLRSLGIELGSFAPVIERAMAVRPDGRFADAGQMQMAWREAARSRPRRGWLALPVAAVGALLAFLGAQRHGTETVALNNVYSAAPSGEIATSASAKAPSGPVDPCQLGEDELKLRLEKLGWSVRQFASVASVNGTNRNIFFTQGLPVAELSMINHGNPRAGEWSLQERWFRPLSGLPWHYFIAESDLCGVTLAGPPGSDLRGLFSKLFGGVSFRHEASHPAPARRRLAEMGPWEFAQRARDAGLSLHSESIGGLVTQFSWKQDPGGIFRAYWGEYAWSEFKDTAAAYAEEGPMLLLVNDLPPARAAGVLRRILGDIHADIHASKATKR